MFGEDLGHYVFRLYLSWALTAIRSIGILLLLVSMVLTLDATYEAMQDTLLILLPITACLFGW